VGMAHDTTLFTIGDLSRSSAESAHDVVDNLTFQLPRDANPLPTSGTITRLDTVHVTVSSPTLNADRTLVTTIEVQFPADAQGNVPLTVNAYVCTLNLYTHRVHNCHKG
jgi:hypothetical protein